MLNDRCLWEQSDNMREYNSPTDRPCFTVNRPAVSPEIHCVEKPMGTKLDIQARLPVACRCCLPVYGNLARTTNNGCNQRSTFVNSRWSMPHDNGTHGESVFGERHQESLRHHAQISCCSFTCSWQDSSSSSNIEVGTVIGSPKQLVHHQNSRRQSCVPVPRCLRW